MTGVPFEVFVAMVEVDSSVVLVRLGRGEAGREGGSRVMAGAVGSVVGEGVVSLGMVLGMAL